MGREIFDEAIKNGEILSVVYAGGQQPGTLREIQPLDIDESHLHAICLATRERKTYRLDALTVISVAERAATKFPAYDPKFKVQHRFSTIAQIESAVHAKLVAWGWVIAMEAQEEDQFLCLHAVFKNGKVKKGPSVSLFYSPMTYDLMSDDNGNPVKRNIRKSPRPWTVRSAARPNAVAYGDPDKAVAFFLDAAEKLAPADSPASD